MPEYNITVTRTVAAVEEPDEFGEGEADTVAFEGSFQADTEDEALELFHALHPIIRIMNFHIECDPVWVRE